LPDVVTDKDLTLWLGSRKVVVRSVEGHTGGDLVVFVPDADVLFTGDLLWRKIAPNLVDGSVKEWIATVSEFERMPAADNVIFVPGHGDVARAADVHEFRSYLVDLERLVRRARANGLSDGALPREVLPKLRALHPGWTINDRSGALEVRYMDEELAGTKRRPVPPDE
jgi:glyoxylase-like metal-dependent hydrolase (beta-lactamase superfamily II)